MNGSGDTDRPEGRRHGARPEDDNNPYSRGGEGYRGSWASNWGGRDEREADGRSRGGDEGARTFSFSYDDPSGEPEHADDSDTKTTNGGRKVGLGAAVALAAVAALAGGAISGLIVGQVGSNDAVSSLDAPSVQQEDTTGEESTGVEAVAEAVLPSVVSIQVLSTQGSGEGSGSIISSDGLVLTNNHVVSAAQNGGRLQVTLNNGEAHPAEFVASDPSTDVALIKISGVSDLPVMEFGDSDQLKVGQPVVAIGSPLGLSSTVTTGIISAKNRPVRASDGGGESSLIDGLQTDAAINPGNSGGPLVDMQGHLVGMNSAIASLSGGGSEGQGGSIGLGFAIPANFAKRVATQLNETGEATYPTLGVQVRPSLSEPGALVAGVVDGSPADEAGIVDGESITKVDDRKIDSADALVAAIRSSEFGQTVTLEVTGDNGDTREVEVTLTDGEE